MGGCGYYQQRDKKNDDEMFEHIKSCEGKNWLM